MYVYILQGTCMFVRLCVNICIDTYIHIFTFTFFHVYTFMYVCVERGESSLGGIEAFMSVCVCVCAYICIYMYTYICMYVYTIVDILLHIFTYICTHTYIITSRLS